MHFSVRLGVGKGSQEVFRGVREGWLGLALSKGKVRVRVSIIFKYILTIFLYVGKKFPIASTCFAGSVGRA